RCEHLLLATGSVAAALPGLPFGGAVISATEALSPAALPGRLVVVGAGYIGLELGMAYRKLGSEVTVVEATDRILPAYDAALAKPVEASLRRLGIDLRLGKRVRSAESLAGDDGLKLLLEQATGAAGEGAADDKHSNLEADQVLVAVGRRPRTECFGLESLPLDMAGAAVKVDEQCRTSMRGVWAIGDLTGEPMLAHRA